MKYAHKCALKYAYRFAKACKNTYAHIIVLQKNLVLD